MKIINLQQIKLILETANVIPEIEKGFVSYSKGEAIIPPVGELLFQDPLGEVHIKYGYIQKDDFYVVKIASGFYENSKFNLPSSNGVMIVFSRLTGEVLGILLDEGYLTDIRTAAAGAIVAKYFAPKKVHKIGMIGSGTQARLQLDYLKNIVGCNQVLVWGRNKENVNAFKEKLSDSFLVTIADTVQEVTDSCNLIVTTTPSFSPLLFAHQIKKGTHITAVGADSPHKQELDPFIFQNADIVVADSITQCIERGDISHAIKNKIISKDKIIELGNVISGASSPRTSDEQITIADLTGVAVQDIQIAKYVYQHCMNENR